MEILMISTARNILNAESRDRERMRLYAQHVEQLHIVLFTQRTQSNGEEIHDGNLHIYPTYSRNRFTILFNAFMVGRRIAKKERTNPLIVTAQDPLWTGWLAWLLTRNAKSTLHIQLHGDYFGSGWSKGSVLRKIAQRTILFLLRRTPAIRVVSERIKQSLREQGIQEEKITVLPIRPELENFLKNQHTYREEPPFTFLFVGRFALEKDVERILKAFEVIYKKRKDIALRLVGQGELEETYKIYIQQHGLEQVVTIEKWNEDVPGVMANADVFLLASKHEAYGLVLLEAMAIGLPVISTDVGCVGEIVKDGVHGVVVKEEGVEAYADAMQKLIADPTTIKTYGANGRKTAAEIAHTSMDAYIDAWVSAMSD